MNLPAWLRRVHFGRAAAAFVIGATLAAGGCHSGPAPADPPAAAAATTQPVIRAVLRPPAQAPVVQLDIFQIAVPRGAISRSDAFWERVDEQRIDPPTYDLLKKNGVRVGLAPMAAWGDYFKDVFDRNNPAVLSGSVTASGSGSAEILMQTGVAEQTIYALNDRNVGEGQTYTKCDNLLEVAFWPELRRAGALRLTVTPMIRATRIVREFTIRNEQREYVERRPEFRYDLNLAATIPADSFMILAPLADPPFENCLGNAFLVINGQADQRENVLVFVPRTIRGGDPSYVPAAGRR